MAGSCDTFIRSVTKGSRYLSIPYRFWGLEPGEKYRAVVRLKDMPDSYPYYSYDVTLTLVSKTARIQYPKCIPGEVGDMVTVWVGKPEDYENNRGPYGRGYTKEERTEYLEMQADILRRRTRESLHNERVP